MRSFEPPTQNQIFLLKKLSSVDGCLALQDKDLHKLSKQQASGMIDAMIRHRKKNCKGRGNGDGNGSGARKVSEGSGISPESGIASRRFLFTQNFRGENGAWQVARISLEEEEALRGAHREYCKRILRECVDDFPKNLDLAVALFEKRCDKFFSWAQAFLEEKVRSSRGNSNGNGNGNGNGVGGVGDEKQ